MLSFRQFLECNDVDTSHVGVEDLGGLNWHFEPAYRMYCNAMAHELQKDVNYKAYVPITKEDTEPISLDNPPSSY